MLSWLSQGQFKPSGFYGWIRDRDAALASCRGVASGDDFGAAMLTAKIITDHLVAVFGDPDSEYYTSAGVASDGCYGVPEGLFFSLPVKPGGSGTLAIVRGLDIPDSQKEDMDHQITCAEEFRKQCLSRAGVEGRYNLLHPNLNHMFI